jgi:hypothetical protein
MGYVVDAGYISSASMSHAGLGESSAGRDCDGALALGPPICLSWVCNDYARAGLVLGRASLLLEGLDNRQYAPLIDSAWATDNATSEHAQLVRRLADDDNDAAFGVEIGAHEDGDMRLCGGGIQRKTGLDEAFLFEALMDNGFYSICISFSMESSVWSNIPDVRSK